MRKITVAFTLSLPLLAFAHQVIGIADGDTLTLLVDRKPVKIRLANIDAPEKAQSWGSRSKQSLSDLCWGKDATYETQDVDRYGRTVAVVKCGGVEVNRAQVERGMAWTYTRYNKDRSLPALQDKARQQGSGLWADGDRAVPPWEFRRAKRGN
jgi:micrococcal nuclease